MFFFFTSTLFPGELLTGPGLAGLLPLAGARVERQQAGFDKKERRQISFGFMTSMMACWVFVVSGQVMRKPVARSGAGRKPAGPVDVNGWNMPTVEVEVGRREASNVSSRTHVQGLVAGLRSSFLPKRMRSIMSPVTKERRQVAMA